MNIVEFLEARIAEDEAVANDATGARWIVLSGVNASMVNIDPTDVRDDKWKYGRFGHIATTSHDAAYAEHIARHDPARVLAECKARRAVIESLTNTAAAHANEGHLGQKLVLSGMDTGLRLALQHLAGVYADHPDYREEWRHA